MHCRETCRSKSIQQVRCPVLRLSVMGKESDAGEKLRYERFAFHSRFWKSTIICVVICVVSRSQLKVSRCLQIKPSGPSAERADPNCSGQGEELLWLCLFACTIQTCLCVRRMFLPSQRSPGQSHARVLGVPVATKEYCVSILFIRFLCKHQQGRRAH